MSLIKAIRHQLGLSITPANNFVLTAQADDGTMKLARGNADATTQDIMTVDAGGKVGFPQNVVPVFRAALASFTNTVANTQFIDPTVVQSIGVSNAAGVVTPQVAGLYLATLTMLCTGTTTALGGVISSTANGTDAQVQPPYGTNSAYVTVSALIQCNGTTDTIRFGVFGSVSGCSFTNIKCNLTLVRPA